MEDSYENLEDKDVPPILIDMLGLDEPPTSQAEFEMLAYDPTWRAELLKEGLISKELADRLDAEDAEAAEKKKKRAEAAKK